jgi:hypothetical protein
MNQSIKQLWVAALRSGDYQQAKGRLRASNNSFCCLGVLCNLHAMARPEFAQHEKRKLSYDGDKELPSLRVRNWSGVSVGEMHRLAELNDYGRSFGEIADFIERTL